MTAMIVGYRTLFHPDGPQTTTPMVVEQPDPGDTIPDEPNDPVEEPDPEGATP